ncbi:MAG: putative glycoside hydrolase [Candidatus Magasanikbacteria bacterium]
MKRWFKKKLGIYIVGVLFGLCAYPFFTYATSAPYLANYYLGIVQDNSSFIDQISRNDLVILTPAQIAAHSNTISQIKKRNPNIIILGYVPSQSYNDLYSHSDPVFRNMSVQDSWWLRDSSGNIISTWTGLRNTNMDHAWSRYLVGFVKTYVMSLQNIDGVFFDMVSDNISWANSGNIDLNSDGSKDNAKEADNAWLERTTYLLSYAREQLGSAYIVTNGSSNSAFQKYVNGRMFETFPTPWEGDGQWGTVMNNAARVKKDNTKPNIIVFNSNTNNSGNSTNFRQVRFGVTSSLLEDNVYFSFDHGDTSHAQLWWYDEYDVDLGQPTQKAVSRNGLSTYGNDVWRRDFDHGLSVVNSTNNTQTISLNGDYEKIHGTQDKTVNDGSVVSEVTLNGQDGIILLKTFEGLTDVLFTNGAFARFLRTDGSRVRNGFFVFDENYKGGDQVALVDLDNNGKRDIVRVHGNKIEAWRDDGMAFLKVYPYTANYTGVLRIAIGDIDENGRMEIAVAPSDGYPAPIKIYNRFGGAQLPDFYPFGTSYKGGYSLAIGNVESGVGTELVVGSGKGAKPRVSVFDANYKLKYAWDTFEPTFTQGINVAVGDINGDYVKEVIVGKAKGGKPTIHIYNTLGKLQYPSFDAFSTFGTPGVEVRSLDVDFDGKEDVVTLSEGAF